MIDIDLVLHQHRHRVDALIKIIQEYKEPLEGNVFFLDRATNISSDQLWYGFHAKRTRLAAIKKKKVLEIGFNSGFSALIMLISDSKTQVVSLDICQHSYTRPCYEYLRSQFGSRIDLIEGDSRDTLPFLLKDDQDFDLYFVDGGHSKDIAAQDLDIVINYAHDGSLILVDDTDDINIRSLVENRPGLLFIEVDKNQILCKINKRSMQEYAPGGALGLEPE